LIYGSIISDAEKEIAKLKKELRDKEDAPEILKKAISILN
ncbi:MAG TPA: transposase, partial [Clostridiales bacterium]|nr:transposase [Clostridiales bacterium]